jgi:hypothetical protein
MPFGRFRGHSLDELPDDYMEWLGTLELREPLRFAVEDELASRAERGRDEESA